MESGQYQAALIRLQRWNVFGRWCLVGNVKLGVAIGLLGQAQIALRQSFKFSVLGGFVLCSCVKLSGLYAILIPR